MLKISNFHVFQMFGSTEGLPIPYRGRSAKKKKKSSNSLALTGTLESQHTLLYCWSPAALYAFSAEQVREEGGKKGACTCDQTAFCDQPWATARLIYDVSSSRGKQQHGLVRKPPYPHFSPPPRYRPRFSFISYYLVFRSPSLIPVVIPRAFLYLPCHFLFSQVLSVLLMIRWAMFS